MSAQPSECNIKVVCRFRPLNDSETKNGSSFTSTFLNDACCVLQDKPYSFDRVFQPHVSQQAVYELTAKPLISNVLSGYNGTIFAYGQTSSGKTFTMEGVVGDPNFQGIIPRTAYEIFSQIAAADPAAVRFSVKVSYFEIYMERIRDLLDPTKQNLEIREDRNRVPYVQGCSERVISCVEDMMAAIEDGKAVKQMDSTNMNEHSSRSHSIFLIKITQEQLTSQKKLTGKLCLVDLAGSEKVSKTGAEGKKLEEAKKINSSLSFLRKVIFSLANGEPFIPYRESKLTRVLQESLGGNAKTTVIVCCSPASYNIEETKSTLQFGVSAKTVKNVVTVNEELTVEEWKRLVNKERDVVRRQDRIIEAAFQELHKWRNGEMVHRSDWVDMASLQHATGISPMKRLAQYQSPRPGLSKQPTAEDLEAMEDVEDDIEDDDIEDPRQQKENLELTATYVADKALLLTRLAEAECEKDLFRKRMEEIKEQLNTALAAIEASGPDDASPVSNPVLDILRGINRKLDGFQNGECTLPSDDIEVDKEEEDETENALQITSRQEDINRQMDKLLHQIKEKEQLIYQTVANADSIEKMRHKHEIEMSELRQKIEGLERERDELTHTTARQSIASKISETRRVRLQEVEKQLAEYRRKIQDLQKLEKVKAENDKMIKTLRSEVEGMKAARVKLMRQMREDTERFRRGQLKVEHEMNQLREQGKKRQFEVERAKQNMEKQLVVFRRKYDEAVAANKRLQQQFDKQKSARNDRFAEIKENGKLIQEIQAFLTDEIGLQVSYEEALLSVEQLESQRSELKAQLEKLLRDQRRFQKKVKFGGTSTDGTDAKAELDRIDLEIASLGEEIELRQTEIEQWQKRMEGFDLQSKDAQRWTNIQTVVTARCALKVLFNMAIDAHMKNLLANHRVSDAETKYEDLQLNLKQLEGALRDSERRAELLIKEYENKMDSREHEHQGQISYFLRQIVEKLGDGNDRMDEQQMAELEQICNTVETRENLSKKLVQKIEEIRQLKQELSKTAVRSGGNRKLFNNVVAKGVHEETDGEEDGDVKVSKAPSSVDMDTTEIMANESIDNNGRPKAKRNRSMLPEASQILESRVRVRHAPVRFGNIVDTMAVISSPTPDLKSVNKGFFRSNTSKRSILAAASKGCKCKDGECDDDCNCKAKKLKCSAQCLCLHSDSCQNRDDQLDESVEKENGATAGDMDSTFVVPVSVAKTEDGGSNGATAVKVETMELDDHCLPDIKTPVAGLGILKHRSPRKKYFDPPTSSKK